MGQGHDGESGTASGDRGRDRDDTPLRDRDDTPLRAGESTEAVRRGGRRGEPPARAGQDWFSRLILWSAAIVVGLALLVIAAAYLPGWWAHRVADVAAGNQVAAVLGGLACGAVFSILPLLAARSAFRPRLRWSGRLVRLLEAVLLTVPVLLTLGVATRGGRDGEVARGVLDVQAPGFAVSTLIGVVLGAALVVASWVLLAGRRRRLHELSDLRTRLELHETRARDDRRDAGTGRDVGARREAEPQTRTIHTDRDTVKGVDGDTER